MPDIPLYRLIDARAVVVNDPDYPPRFFQAKLLAEAAELWEEIKWNYQGAERDFVDAHAEIDAQVYGMGLVIDRWFKDREVWTKASLTKTSELDDVQVVLCCMSADLGHDSMAGALTKALADISRGVR